MDPVAGLTDTRTSAPSVDIAQLVRTVDPTSQAAPSPHSLLLPGLNVRLSEQLVQLGRVPVAARSRRLVHITNLASSTSPTIYQLAWRHRNVEDVQVCYHPLIAISKKYNHSRFPGLLQSSFQNQK
ncbi:unnamed protein product [Protopolystoma xenopodis]|uniref:Uncharacterized protein n=1 Tax=Protopolystoma xenopodis TaxID=117903 RepID=A0A3S5BG40_9PLAT|nr:unnamed protein product [Protopolystoma xenopodis]